MGRTLRNTPIIRRIIQRFEQEITTHGWQAGLKNIANRFAVKLIVKGQDADLLSILQRKPVLLMTNHPYEAEILTLIASLPARDDFHLVANANLMDVSPLASEKIIPVYINHRTQNNQSYEKPFLGRVLDTFHAYPVLSDEEERTLNKQSVKTAASYIANGHLVAICPGRHSPDGKWFNGVGHLVSQIPSNDYYIVMVYTQGTRSNDYLRVFPIINKLFPPVIVNYFPAIPANEITATDPKTITQELQARYQGLVKTVETSS